MLTLSALNLACKAALLGAVVVSVDQEELKAVEALSGFSVYTNEEVRE